MGANRVMGFAYGVGRKSSARVNIVNENPINEMYMVIMALS